MARKSSGGSYYYAGGEKIQLTPADDLRAIKASEKEEASQNPAPSVRPLSDGLQLISKDDLDDVVEKTAEDALKYPVFRSQGAIIVALPEVRVEESRTSHQAKLQEWLTEHRDDVEVVSHSDDRVVLKPSSGSGRDALAIANALTEHVRPEMAQTRFIRVTPRPNSSGREEG